VIENGAERQEAARVVEETIEQQIFEFQRWYTGHAAGDTIRAVRERAEEIRQVQLKRALKRLNDLDEQDRRLVEIFSEQLVNALLHEPISQLRDPHDGPTNAAYLRALFGIEAGQDEPLDTPHDDAHQTVA
jgi:glutamyl-tRNA reductase